MKKVINLVVLGFGLGCGVLLANAIKTTTPSNMFSKYTNGLPDNIWAETVFEDSSNNIWLGTSNNEGLWERLAGTTDFTNIITIPNKNNINVVYQSKDGSIWVGGDMGLYSKSSSAGAFSKVESGLPVGIDIKTIYEDSSNNIWLGTIGNGLWEKLNGTDNFIQITSGLGLDVWVNNILEISNNILITSNQGLWEKSSGGDNFIKKLDGDFNSLYNDFKHNLWVGGDKLWEKANGTDDFIQINISKDIENYGLNSITNDSENNLWLGGNGLWEKANGTDNFIQITSGVPNNEISKILSDTSHSIWLATTSPNGGLYVSNSGVGYNLSPEATSTTYNDGTNNWILSNKAITFWARGSNITSIDINGASYSTGEFSLDGTNYQASGGRYQITVNYSGGKPTEKYYFGIKNRIVSDLGFATLSGDKLEAYTGYLFGDKTRAVKVEYVYDPNFASQAVLNMALENEYIIDWSQTYLQQLDTTTLKPIGDKIALSTSSESVNKDGFYQLVITDKLGNSDIYYIQVGGKTKIIPDTPTPINPSNPTNMAWWEILLIVLGVIGGFLLLFFIYARTHMYLTIDRHNKKAHQKPKEKKVKIKK